MDLKQRREWSMVLVMVIIIRLIHGTYVKHKFKRIAGDDGTDDVPCLSSVSKDPNYVAAKIDASRACTGLDWGWGAAPSFDPGATYYERKQFTKVYNPPLYINKSEGMVLPVRFGYGAYFDMSVTLLSNDFGYGVINLLDTLDDYNLDVDPLETLMISFEMKPIDDYVIILSKREGWETHVKLIPYPFDAGSTHVITFKALTNELQVLVDGTLVIFDVAMGHRVPSENARKVYFCCRDIQLNAIDFVGV